MSEEHFLPAGLGEYKDCPKLKSRVCAKCNTKIGDELEVQFLRVGPIGLMRWIVGLRGRKVNSPSPFLRGAAKTKAVVALGRLKDFDFDVALETKPGTRDCQPMAQIILKHNILGYRPFPIFDGMTKESFLAQIGEEGFRNAQPVHAFAHPSEQARVEEIASVLQAKMGPQWAQTPINEQEIEVEATVTVTPQLFYREIAKIAFHYMLTFCPSLQGGESEFQPIRDYIWSGTGRRPVQETQQQVFTNFDRGERPTNWSHFLYLIRANGLIVAYVQVFAGPQYLPFPYRVDIGADPRTLILPPERIGHQFVILTPGDKNNQVGEMVDAQLVQKIIPVFRTGRLIS